MGTGYTRNDTPNNIADGNVINASDLDGEFDSIQAAFNASTGHSHDGTTGEGPQIDTGGIANDAVTLGTKTSGNYVATGAVSGVGLSGSASSEGATFTITSNATSANTGSTIVARDASGNFSAGTITASLTGTASNAALLDSIDSTSFLRSDAADTKTSGDLSFSDNVKAVFGAGSDLQIYHDGSNSYVDDAGAGSLYIRSDGVMQIQKYTGEVMQTLAADGAVTLYYDNVPKIITTSTGVDVTGVITTDGMTTSADINFGDNDKAVFGAGSDLQIYHDGSNSYVQENGTGNLRIRANNLALEKASGGEYYLLGTADGSLRLYYDAAQKLITAATGVDVTGTITSDGLTVDGVTKIGYASAPTWDTNSYLWSESGVGLNVDGFRLKVNTGSSRTERMRIDTTGDISFYDSTGVTQGLFWDASAQRLGLGTTAVSDIFTVKGSGVNQILTSLQAGGTSSECRIELIGTNSTSGVSQQVHIGAYQPSGGAATDAALDFRVRKDGDSFDSPTTIMTLTDGNVGIGTTSPSDALTVSTSTVNAGVTVSGSTDPQYFLNSSGGNQARFKINDATPMLQTGSWTNIPVGFYTNGSERLRIDNSGKVGIGTSSPTHTLDVNGPAKFRATSAPTWDTNSYVWTESGFGLNVESYQIKFNAGATRTERVRIDTAGNLLVGYGGQTTTAFGQPQGMTIGSLDNVALQYYLRKGNQVEARIGFKASTDTNFYVGSGGGTGPGGIGVYGVYLTNLGNSWNSVSDETQKTIVENIENASEKVSTLRTVMGYYNNDENETRRPFLIAQDVQAVLPEAVSVQDIETGVLGMSYTDVIPLLTAAIKEQRETINSLEARITALEAN